MGWSTPRLLQNPYSYPSKPITLLMGTGFLGYRCMRPPGLPMWIPTSSRFALILFSNHLMPNIDNLWPQPTSLSTLLLFTSILFGSQHTSKSIQHYTCQPIRSAIPSNHKIISHVIIDQLGYSPNFTLRNMDSTNGPNNRLFWRMDWTATMTSTLETIRLSAALPMPPCCFRSWYQVNSIASNTLPPASRSIVDTCYM